jgi:polyisoprenoid-binding protein YceI
VSASHRLGPDNASLSVHTGRGGAAAKAGHDLILHVTSWEATLALGETPEETSVELSADATSLRVREGTGGMQALDEDDIANIHQTIDDEVLIGERIGFRSTGVREAPGGGATHVEGELSLVGRAAPVAFDLALGEDGTLSARAVVKQTDWGIKPYSALFGALKVKDEVQVVLEGHL